MENKSKASLLVVDDEVEIQQMLSRHFRFLGYDVETASNGREALELLAKKRTEVIISDIKMPQLDGIELLKIVKEQHPMSHVIIITGYVTLDNLLAVFRRGADTCIFKPWHDMSELESAVAHAFETIKIWKHKLRQLYEMKPPERRGDG